MEFQTVIEKRRSIRNFDPGKEVSREQIETLIRAASLEESADIPLLLYPVPLSDRGVPSEMPLGI